MKLRPVWLTAFLFLAACSDEGAQPTPQPRPAVTPADAEPRDAPTPVPESARAPREVAELIARLKKRDVRDPARLVLRLVALGEPAVVPLIQLLQWPTPVARRSAARCLQIIGDPRGIVPVVEALGRADPDTGAYLSTVLARWGKPTVPALVASLSNENPRARLLAVRSLGSIGDAGTVEPLIDLCLREPDKEVRREIVSALCTKPDPRAVQVLLKALEEDDGHLQNVVPAALIGLGKPAVKPLVRSLSHPRIGGRVALILGAIGDEGALKPLIESLRGDSPLLRSSAALALGQFRGGRGVDVLIGNLADPDAEVRVTACIALGQIGHVRAAGPLLRALEDDWAGVRFEAAVALGRLRFEPAVESLVNLLADHGKYFKHTVGEAAAKALGHIGDPRAVQPLLAYLRLGGASMRQAAARALGGIARTNRSFPHLMAALGDPEEGVRESSAQALGMLREGRAVPLLCRSLRDRSADVGAAAAWALGEIGDRRAVQPLIESLRNLLVQDKAARALAKLDAQEAVPSLVNTLRTSLGTGVHEALKELTGQDLNPDFAAWSEWLAAQKK